MKRELSLNVKLTVSQSICVPTIPYGHDHWVVTERMRSQIQASKMGLNIRRKLRLEQLLLCTEWSQLRPEGRHRIWWRDYSVLQIQYVVDGWMDIVITVDMNWPLVPLHPKWVLPITVDKTLNNGSSTLCLTEQMQILTVIFIELCKKPVKGGDLCVVITANVITIRIIVPEATVE